MNMLFSIGQIPFHTGLNTSVFPAEMPKPIVPAEYSRHDEEY